MTTSMFVAALADAIVSDQATFPAAAISHDEDELTVVIGNGERFSVTVTKLYHALDI